MNLDSEPDKREYENLRQLQNLTEQGDEIVDQKGISWYKNEHNWWLSNRGEEVLGSHFFDYGIKVYHPSAKPLFVAEQNPKPHSRACGWRQHDHGSSCSDNCPTCGGK